MNIYRLPIKCDLILQKLFARSKSQIKDDMFITGGIPFVSLVTKSELLKEAYVLFLREELGIEKKINRNKRDNVFNITVKLESAVKLANLLYFNDSIGSSIQPLYLDRKFNSAKQVILWKR